MISRQESCLIMQTRIKGIGFPITNSRERIHSWVVTGESESPLGYSPPTLKQESCWVNPERNRKVPCALTTLGSSLSLLSPLAARPHPTPSPAAKSQWLHPQTPTPAKCSLKPLYTAKELQKYKAGTIFELRETHSCWGINKPVPLSLLFFNVTVLFQFPHQKNKLKKMWVKFLLTL